MLRINLLPPYIYEGATRKKWIVLWALIIVVAAGSMVGLKVKFTNQAKKIAAETAKLQPIKTQVESLNSQSASINSASADIRTKVEFVSNALKYDLNTYPSLFNHVTTYTLRNVIYDSIIPAGSTVTMSAYARTLSDVAHYMMAMERNKEINNVSIQIGSIPGFPVTPGYNIAAGGQGVRPNDGYGHNFSVTLSLVNAIPGGPTYGNAPPVASAGGPGGAPMGGMGMGSMMGSYGGSGGGRRGPMGGGSGGMMSGGGPGGYSGGSGGMMSGGSGGPGGPGGMRPPGAPRGPRGPMGGGSPGGQQMGGS